MPPAIFGPPPVALETLSIRDFRGIDKLDLDFRGPDGLPNRLVVIAGPNGSGKTAVVEAALIAAGGRRLAVGQRGKRAIRRGAVDYDISATFRRDDSSFTSHDDSSLSEPALNQPVPHWYFSSWRAPSLPGPVDVTVGRPGRRPQKNDQNRLLNVKQQLVNVAAVERFSMKSPRLFGTYSKWISLINSAWSRFDTSCSEAFAVDLRDLGDLAQAPFDVFYCPQGRDRLSVDLLSAGQLEVFLFLAALVLNDGREGIIFIDEPELHLDPQWHRLVLRCLMDLQPQAQFIVATHSPEIYDSARSYERHFLVSEDDPRASIWGDIRAVGAEA